MMKNFIKFIFTALIFVLFSCEKEEINVNANQNAETVEKHFVKIEDIKAIVAGEKFKQFLTIFENNESTIISSNRMGSELSVLEYEEQKDKNQVTAFYMTKLSNNKFVLFAADDRSHTVMAVTDIADVNATISSIPDEFSSWLDDEIKAIEFARDNYIAQTIEVEKEWVSYRALPPEDPTICGGAYHINKWPLLTTNWGQGNTYNDYTPILGCTNYYNGHAPTGCVATATAQIMRYHQWPNSYNWNAMPNNWGSTETSRLMSDIGNIVGMNYDCNGSGTEGYKPMYALRQNFGYSSALYDNYNYTTVLNELKQDKPVILMGAYTQTTFLGYLLSSKGHEWVTDGFMEGYECYYDQSTGYPNGGYGYVLFHMNWGWSGSYNMYCGLNNFTVNGTSYNYQKKMIYGIRK